MSESRRTITESELMSKQQPIRSGDKFRDANGEVYTVLNTEFGDVRWCQVDELDGGRIQIQTRDKQLRAMTRVSNS